MYPDSDRIEALFTKYIQGTLAPGERLELDGYVEQYPQLQQLLNEVGQESLLLEIGRFIKQPIPHPPFGHEHKPNSSRFRLWRAPYIRAVAAVLLMVGIGLLFFKRDHGLPKEAGNPSRYANDVGPGTDKAVMILGDGQVIDLKEGQNGIVVGDGVTYADGSPVLGTAQSETKPEDVGSITVNTPNGGQYQVTLPDGSTARLNAASTLRFPAKFSGDERAVEMTGEVYFDVKKNTAAPFRVKLPHDVHVEVLGTTFNVRSYLDEATMKATLRTGAVRVNTDRHYAVLKPGEQAIFAERTDAWVVAPVDVDVELAWQAGFFYFNGTPLDEIMRQLGRWYDVDVVFEEKIDEKFEIMMMPRAVALSKLLNLLELTGHVRFKIEGRRVFVMR